MGDTAKHDLSEIDVDEVSAVDRAANKRKFILAKNDSGEVGMAGEKDEGGAGTGGAGTEGAAGAAGTETAKAGEEKPGEGAAGTGDAAATETADEPDETENAKKATAHETLLAEKVEALRGAADKIVSAVESMDFADASAQLDAMYSVLWSMRDVFNVVKLSKAEGGQGLGKSEKVQKAEAALAAVTAKVDGKRQVLVAKEAARAAGAKVPAKKDALTTPTPTADAASLAASVAAIEKHLGVIAGHLGGIAEMTKAAQKPPPAVEPPPTATQKAEADRLAAVAKQAAEAATAAVSKGLQDLAGRVAKVEKATPDSNATPPAGAVNKGAGDGTTWPRDMAKDAKDQD